MNIGLAFPQTEAPSDPSAIRDYAQTAEGLGFTHIVAYDHILGANPNREGGWKGIYSSKDSFQEPFVLFSYMAAFTQKIQFVPGVIILPQRQTALVAKQAATLDVLSNGRLRLGVGLGWNEIEYIALNQNFHNRNKRMEEQVTLLRQLWTQPHVTFKSKWHDIRDAGLTPLPVQRPIPIWFGANVDEAVKRAALLGDGWLMNQRTPEDAKPRLEKLDQYLAEAKRSRKDFGVEGRLPYGEGDKDDWRLKVEGWKTLGVTHLSFNAMGKGFNTAEAHLKAVREFAEVLSSAY